MLSLENLRWAGFRAFINTRIYVIRSSWFSPTTQPDLVKTYPCRPNLFASRIFWPRGFSQDRKLPLVIRVHGGGFVLNNPAADDPLARHLADHADCIVVSIDYSKAPQNKFPTGYEDVVAQCLAVIDDTELPIDRNAVVLCGSSAGGNLVLGAVQDKRLASKILGVVGMCPLVDMVTKGEAKMATRPNPSIPDFIGNGYDGIVDLYLDSNQKESLQDIRLSPALFISRDSLPPHTFFIGAEHDMFCHEAEAMAEKLVTLSSGSKKDTKFSWQAPGVTWHKILGQKHAFEVFPEKDPEMENARGAAVEELYTAISDWLLETFSRGPSSEQ